ncbi:hypothetical protein PUN28_006986 [Cardiocondyla obscurior]|uniref:Secreted protein n=1 Tax=Cardiocondyla obscurior TaxID=286306 RepID=A0AAW2G749_9HYME
MPAGKQMVAPFIGLFVGSAMTFCPAMKQAGDSPCVGEHQAMRLQLLSLLKRIRELACSRYTFSAKNLVTARE